MPELRKDPVVGRWVIISTDRGRRPSDYTSQSTPRDANHCPFCPGHENQTPPEVLAVRHDGSAHNAPGWKVRVVPNKFPALQIEGDLERRGEGLFDKMNGIGAHEVIIESTDHHAELSTLSVDDMALVLGTYRARMIDLKGDPRFKYILVFKNWGEAAGATLQHPHTQLIAMPIIPKWVSEELKGSRSHFEMKERCIYCDILQQETADGRRLITADEHYVAIVPFAPRFPFESWVLPRKHSSSFEALSDDGLWQLARMLKETLTRMNMALNNPPYNFIIHTAPCNDPWLLYYHWHIEIMPRLTKVAGFEWGSGFYINPTSPEDAARDLKNAIPAAVPG
ncbi:MAG: galactose-1-phosphate uridylyltransferase [Candidatus Eisenbacteria bacterium]|nr:galactose-1-phosphate uridylyltransferase [Candidatus Eisenbacteria bacterium]